MVGDAREHSPARSRTKPAGGDQGGAGALGAGLAQGRELRRVHGEAVQSMKDVNGWLVPDGYDGCRNCAQRGVGAFCHLAAEHRESIPVCLYWEGTDDEMPMQEELREAQRDVPA